MAVRGGKRVLGVHGLGRQRQASALMNAPLRFFQSTNVLYFMVHHVRANSCPRCALRMSASVLRVRHQTGDQGWEEAWLGPTRSHLGP